MRNTCAALLLLASVPLHAQTNWFNPAKLDKPPLKKALDSLDRAAIVDEWIKLTEVPSPTGKEQTRAEYVKGELQKLGLTDIRTDSMSNVSGVRKGTGRGPTVVFAAHLDTVFPLGTDLKVKRNGDILSAPGIGDDTVNVIGLLEAFRALNRAGIKTKGDLIFLASSQEEIGLLGAKYWLLNSGYKPDMFIAADSKSNEVWYGALRIDQLKFFFTADGAHTLVSRGKPSPVRAVGRSIAALYEIPLPPLSEGIGEVRLPTMNIGTMSGGTAPNAIPTEAWFTIDLRSVDSETQDSLREKMIATVRDIANQEHVGFRMELIAGGIDYSKARPQKERLNHPLVQTALATANHFRAPGTPEIVPMDIGSTDANNAISLGIPAVAIGVARGSHAHQLDEYSDASSVVPGIKSIITLAVALTDH
jgi:tripeptide aminopeptidase